MKYLALIHTSDEQWAAQSDAERSEMYGRYRTFTDDVAASGKLLDGAELQPATTATTVRVRGDETIVSDGPFAETREQIGGYYLFDCASIDEAVELAARIPGAQHGTIEVRAHHEDDAS